MATKQEEDKVVIIPLSERIPELEERVRYFVMKTPDLPYNEVKHHRVRRPIHANDWDQERWEIEEIRRCKYGHKGMGGKMYSAN